MTAKVVHQAAAEFKSKPGRAVKALKKPASAPRLNLKSVLKLIDEIEKLAVQNKPLLAKVAALRTYMVRLEGK
jgi:hypothetical protein